MAILLDTRYLISFYNKHDQSHDRALEISEKIETHVYGTIYVTDSVFLEFINYSFKRVKNTSLVIEAGQKILDSEIELIEIDRELLDRAWVLFKQRKNLTLTDATIVEAMKENKIKYLASWDSEFIQFKEIQLIR